MVKHTKITIKNTTPALDLSVVKSFCKIDEGNDSDESLIKDVIIPAVAEACEKEINGVLLSTTLEHIQDEFDMLPARYSDMVYPFASNVVVANYGSRFIDLPYKPAIAITSVKTYDSDNTEDTVSSSYYLLDNSGRLIFNDNLIINMRLLAGLKVTYTAGFGSKPTDIPADLRLAMLQHARDIYENISKTGDNFTSSQKIPDGSLAIYKRYRNLNGI